MAEHGVSNGVSFTNGLFFICEELFRDRISGKCLKLSLPFEQVAKEGIPVLNYSILKIRKTCYFQWNEKSIKLLRSSTRQSFQNFQESVINLGNYWLKKVWAWITLPQLLREKNDRKTLIFVCIVKKRPNFMKVIPIIFFLLQSTTALVVYMKNWYVRHCIEMHHCCWC